MDQATATALAGKPRIVLYVNRELVDEKSGFKLAGRTEKTESATGTNKTEKISAENRYHNFDKPSPTLADKQTVRDVERLFGRPFRMGGANLADQQIAAQTLGDRKLSPSALLGVSEAARKDRAALAKVADVVIEILMSSRNVNVPGLSGDQTYAMPDIQATAIRLSDARVLGQAASAEMTGRDARSARSFGFRDIAEATALALMEDMCGN